MTIVFLRYCFFHFSILHATLSTSTSTLYWVLFLLVLYLCLHFFSDGSPFLFWWLSALLSKLQVRMPRRHMAETWGPAPESPSVIVLCIFGLAPCTHGDTQGPIQGSKTQVMKTSDSIFDMDEKVFMDISDPSQLVVRLRWALDDITRFVHLMTDLPSIDARCIRLRNIFDEQL